MVFPARQFFSALLLLLLFASPGRAQEVGVPQSLPATPLQIVTGDGVHDFEVEVARTNAEMATGLMFRTEMAENQGMIFDYSPPRRASMWMKNTYIPLDILFVLPDGTVLNIVANTTPLSRASISAAGRVRAALELNAGMVEKLGIEAGDVVRHEIFGNYPDGED